VISSFAFIFAPKTLKMDIRHYFDSVDFTAFYNTSHLNWKYTLGAAIEKNTHAVTKENIHKTNIAVIGIPFDSGKAESFSTDAPGKIRAELYQLSKFESKINIVDFGDLKPASSVKGNYQALRDIVDYFNELKIVTIVIGGSQDLSVGICEAFRGNPWFSFSTIDAFLDVKKAKEPFDSFNYLSRLFIGQPQIFQFNLIGFQGHYLASESLVKIKSIGHHVRLGNLRNNFSVAEPVLRNTDFLSFDINSVKYSEAPGVLRANPNGLRSEEACQLAKFAGLSNRLKVFGLFDVAPENDMNNLTVKLSAQIIWYFLEGYINRDIEKPGAGENSITYQVEVDNVDKPIVFFKDSITGRWWMEIETIENRKLCFACSEREYEQASNNEIPELWLKYIQKIDELLK
jgi:arginase family enzyme